MYCEKTWKNTFEGNEEFLFNEGALSHEGEGLSPLRFGFGQIIKLIDTFFWTQIIYLIL